MSTLSMTQCWFTRLHHPRQTPKERVEGAFYAHCRHCRRPIISFDGSYWHIDGGFNVESLGDKANSFLAVVDVVDGMIVARVPVPHDADEEAVEAIKEQIREDYGIGEEGKFLAIHDNRPGHRTQAALPKRKKKPQPPKDAPKDAEAG